VTSILKNATDAQLAASIEANLFALFQAVLALPGSEIVEGERLSYHHTPIPGPMFNAIWRARLDPDQIDAAIDEALGWFSTRPTPLVAWWFSQQMPDLFARLETRGFEFDYDALGMAIDIETIKLRLPDGFEVVEARDEKTLDDWADVLYGAYEEYHMPMQAARVWPDATLAFAGNAPWRMYVGYWNGKPVATNMLFNGGGVAGLYCIGTIPEARGKGFGSAVTLQPLLDAQAEGYRYGVLFAAEMGIPMYRKSGFRDVGINIGRYVRVSEP
jgi:ribosomal protein S18 acetylase RimI-like enzyme